MDMIEQKYAAEVLATLLGQVANHYRKCVRRRMSRPLELAWHRPVKDDRKRERMCGTGMLRAAERRLYRRQARILFALLKRAGFLVINPAGQVLSHIEVSGIIGSLLNQIEEQCYDSLRSAGINSFDEIELDDPLIHTHFAKRAETLLAGLDEHEIGLFFIGAAS